MHSSQAPTLPDNPPADTDANLVTQVLADAAAHGEPLEPEAAAAVVARARAASVHTRRRAMMNHLAAVPGVWPPVVSFFDSGEHSVISAGINLTFTGGRQVPASTYQIVFNQPWQNGLSVTYGQLIALGGDFYADPERPISNQPPRDRGCQVRANLNSLVAVTESKAEAQQILATMARELSDTAQAEFRGIDPNTVYVVKGNSYDLAYNGITGGSSVTQAIPGRYERIAATNWDHFGADALTSYRAGHAEAIALALQAQTDADLDQAYALNAFADHYLTDLFSAGHLRTTRRQLFERQYGATSAIVDPRTTIWTPDSTISGLLAKCQHDEDSLNGLWVTNANGDRWICYGDGMYRNPQNYANAALVQLAVNTSINEVYQAYATRQAPASYAAENLIPTFNRDWNTTENYSPLFLMSGSQVLNRNDESNLSDYTHSSFYLYSAYLMSPDAPIMGQSLFATQTMVLKSVQATPTVDPIGANGTLGTSPTPVGLAVNASGRVDVVVVVDGALQWRCYNQGTWGAWTLIGYGWDSSASAPRVTSVPTLMNDSSGNLHVFVLTSSNRLMHNWQKGGKWQKGMDLSGWEILPGTWGSALVPSVPATSQVAVLGLDLGQHLQQITFTGSWNAATSLGGTSMSLPSVVTRSSVQDVFCLGTDQAVWYRTTAASGAWARMTMPGACTVSSQVGAASWSSTRLDWVARTTTGKIAHGWMNGTTWDAAGEIINAPCASAPCLASTAANSLDLVYVATDGTLRCRTYTGGAWQSEVTFSVGSPLAARQPVLVATGTRLDVVYVGVDGALHHASRARVGTGWSAWETIGSVFQAGPPGYRLCAKEGDQQTFNSSVDLAFGVNGHFAFKYRTKGKITFNTSTFGDPAKGQGKFGYVRPAVGAPPTNTPTGYSLVANENDTVNFTAPQDVAFGANGNYTFRSAMTGQVTFNIATFGDPAPNIVKAGYAKPTYPGS